MQKYSLEERARGFQRASVLGHTGEVGRKDGREPDRSINADIVKRVIICIGPLESK